MSDARRAKASKTSKTSNNLSPAPAGGKRRLAAALALTGLTALMLTPAAAQPGAAKEHEAPSRPHVYLLRGLMNIFSLGMDQLAAKIAQHGIEASVHNHAEADAVVSEIAARYSAGDRGADYPHWAFARRRCSHDDGAIVRPGRSYRLRLSFHSMGPILSRHRRTSPACST